MDLKGLLLWAKSPATFLFAEPQVSSFIFIIYFSEINFGIILHVLPLAAVREGFLVFIYAISLLPKQNSRQLTNT